jgi:hypothetical protein
MFNLRWVDVLGGILSGSDGASQAGISGLPLADLNGIIVAEFRCAPTLKEHA